MGRALQDGLRDARRRHVQHSIRGEPIGNGDRRLTDNLQTLVARRVITARQAEAGRQWASDREVGEFGSGIGKSLLGARHSEGIGGLDMRAVARRRWLEAAEQLQEFRGVCEAVVMRGQAPTAWAAEAGKPPQTGPELLRLGLTRLAAFYQVMELA